MARRHRDDKEEIRRTIDNLLRLLKSKSLSTLTTTVIAIGTFGRDAAYAAEHILPFIEHADDVLRSAAMHTLAEIAFGAKAIISSLRAMLPKQTVTSDPYTTCRVYWVLERIERT